MAGFVFVMGAVVGTLPARFAGSRRDFTWQDTAASPPVAIVTASAARALFPRGQAIGQHVRVGNDPNAPPAEIVGVIDDISMGDVTRRDIPVLFQPALQNLRTARSPFLQLRTSVPPATVAPAVRKAVASMGHDYVPPAAPAGSIRWRR